MERYEIVIIDRRQKKDTNVSGEDKKKKPTNVSGQDQEDEEQKDNKKEKKVTASVVAKTALNEARSLILPHIGEVTRDSLLQEKIDNTASLVDTAISFAIHPAMGAVNLATKTASKMISLSVTRQKEITRLQVALQRASYVNRSRE